VKTPPGASLFPICFPIFGKPTDNFGWQRLTAAAHRGEPLGPQRVDVRLRPRK